MRVTAETITGEQILELWSEAGATQAARAFGHHVPDPAVSMSICEQANGDGYWPGWRNVAAARERCAAAWNARHGDSDAR